MQAGLLWFDNDPTRTIAVKVIDAAERFLQKFGTTPSVCFVSNRSVKEETNIPFRAGQIRITPVSDILVNHFWIGVDGV